MELGSDRSLGVPEAADEYDCKLSPLLHRLHDGASMNEIRDWLRPVRSKGNFGPRGDPVREGQLAMQISAWWRRRATESSAD